MDIVCEGLMIGHSGFAEAMRNVVLSLDAKGCKVKTIIHDNATIGTSKELVRIKELERTELKDKIKTWITMTYPLGVCNHEGHYSIAYVMFETEVWPDDFTKHLIDMDEIWTPSTFCKDAMVKAGLKNVHVIPLGVDVERFNPKNIESLACPPEMEGKFKFLSIFGWSERKGCSLLARAFAEEFQGQNDVALYMKGGWYRERRARRDVFNKLGDIPNPPYIHIDFKIYPFQDLPRLYKLCDCFVMPTRGEGWGLEFTEAMAMEMPTIGTRWGGQLEFMDDDNSYLIDINGVKPCPTCDWISAYYKGQNFADPSKEHLRKLMRYVYEHRDESKTKGKYARQDMINRFTWAKSMQKAYDRLEAIHG